MVKKKTKPWQQGYDKKNPPLAFRPDADLRAFIEKREQDMGVNKTQIIVSLLNLARTGQAENEEARQAGYEAGRNAPIRFRWPCPACSRHFDFDLRDLGDLMAFKSLNKVTCTHPKDTLPKAASNSAYI